MDSFKPIVPRIISGKNVVCGFTTRNGGVSSPPYQALNLGYSTQDDPECITENHKIVYRYIGIDKCNVALMGQVHSSVVNVVDSGGIFEKTDGLITSKAGVMLGVLVADCIPLLLYDPVHDVIGAVHCGWRSIVEGAAEKALVVMNEHFSSVPHVIIAVLGPSAGKCCYEVGSDVAHRLSPGSVNEHHGGLYADLKAELTERLINAGVKKNSVELFNDCTICKESLYFSYRRDGIKSGRMMGYIMLKSEI